MSATKNVYHSPKQRQVDEANKNGNANFTRHPVPPNMPRTKSGLIPTSYRNAMDVNRSPKLWQPLPPRPPPIMFPYRGDYVKEARNNRKRRDTNSWSSSSPAKISEKKKKKRGDVNNKQLDTMRNESATIKKQSGSSTKERPEWNSSNTDSYLFQLSPQQKKLKDKSKNDSNDYIRHKTFIRQEKNIIALLQNEKEKKLKKAKREENKRKDKNFNSSDILKQNNGSNNNHQYLKKTGSDKIYDNQENQRSSISCKKDNINKSYSMSMAYETLEELKMNELNHNMEIVVNNEANVAPDTVKDQFDLNTFSSNMDNNYTTDPVLTLKNNENTSFGSAISITSMNGEEKKDTSQYISKAADRFPKCSSTSSSSTIITSSTDKGFYSDIRNLLKQCDMQKKNAMIESTANASSDNVDWKIVYDNFRDTCCSLFENSTRSGNNSISSDANKICTSSGNKQCSQKNDRMKNENNRVLFNNFETLQMQLNQLQKQLVDDNESNNMLEHSLKLPKSPEENDDYNQGDEIVEPLIPLPSNSNLLQKLLY